MVTPPLTDYGFSSAAYDANLALKKCTPLFLRPPDIALEPNTADGCRYDSSLEPLAQNRKQRMHEKRGFFFQLDSPLPSPHDEYWGPLGTPDAKHYNSGVAVMISELRDSRGFVTWANPFDPNLAMSHPANPPGEMTLELPVGTTTVEWKAATLWTDLDGYFIYIPEVPPGWKVPAATDLVIEFALDLGILTLGQFDEVIPTYVSAGTVIDLEQTVEVYDRIPPEVFPGQSHFVFEGTEIGGASMRTNVYAEQLREAFSYDDPCGDTLTLVPPEKKLWRVGEQTPVTWTVLDEGPNPDSPRDDRRNATTLTQYVTVVDTIAPTIKPMRGKVVERPSGATADMVVELPGPEVFDFVDADVAITNDAPTRNAFPLGPHTVTWTATDQSGNSTTAEQIVNVKVEGTNQPPVATPQAGDEAVSAQSYTEIEIALAASDPDGDPIWFEIATPPIDGFFVAPLLPYFFGDLRWPEQWNDRCKRPTHAIYDPEYVKLLDDGRMVVLQAPMFEGCPGSTLEKRISVYSQINWRNDIQRGREMDGLPNDVYGALHVDEAEGFILYSRNHYGPNTFVKLDLDTLDILKDYRMPLGDGSRKGVIDVLPDGREILYVTTNVLHGQVDVYDLTRANASSSVEVVLGAADRIASYHLSSGGEQPTLDIALDREGNLYVSQLGAAYNDRLHKFGPVTIGFAGELLPGEHIGWMGACIGGSGCDGATQTSRGYSCTAATCVPGNTTATRSGPGQFDRLGGIAVDPNDILYVSEWGGQRIQRFTPDGYYAGQAKNECDQELCFVLGQFGKPRHVAVNSSQFVVLDTELDVLHIFDTGVVELTSPTTAKVTYKSESGFLGTDRFEFIATDGLDESAPATVEVSVGRGYHEPTARGDIVYLVAEDTPSPVFLAASDLDYPLDTMTYTLIEGPEHGTLQGDAPNFTYVPDPDFVGEDSLSFSVNDGTTESAPATPRIIVTPVNDAPVVIASVEVLEAGADYGADFDFEFRDVEGDDRHTVEFRFSDGATWGEWRTNVYIAENGGAGIVTTNRKYGAPGSHWVEACVTDDGHPAQTGCATMQIEVVEGADLVVEWVHSRQPVQPGWEFSRSLEVGNAIFGSSYGNPAPDTELVPPLPPEIELRNAYASQGSCAEEAQGGPNGERALVCQLGTIQQRKSVDVTIAGRVSGDPGVLRATATSSLPDPHDPSQATTRLEMAANHGFGAPDTLVLFGEALQDGTISATVGGEVFQWDFRAGDELWDIVLMFTIELYNSEILSNMGIFPSIDGRSMRVNAQLENLTITPGAGLRIARPVRVVDARLSLDFDSLGFVTSPPYTGTVWVGEKGEIHVPIDTIALFRGTMPIEDPEVTALRVEDAHILGGHFVDDGEGGLVGTELDLIGKLEIDQFTPSQETSTFLEPIGSGGSVEVEMGSDRTFVLTGGPFQTTPFTLEAWNEANGTTGERTYTGIDDRDEAGTRGRVTLVSPMQIEILSSDGALREIPGGVTLTMELVPEPSAGALAATALLCVSGLRKRSRDRS